MRVLKQPRSRATQERIVRAAARLFALKGFHDTKLEEILKAAKVTTGAFFHHFDSKEDLGFAVLDRHMEKRRCLLEKIEEDMDPPDEDDPLRQVFRRLDAIEEMVRQREHRKGGCIIGNLSTALSDTHEAFRRRLAECFDEMAEDFKPALDAAVHRQDARATRKPVNTLELARYMVSVIEGSIMLARTHRDRSILARHFEQLKRYLQQTFNG